jgi:hypothetical protein
MRFALWSDRVFARQGVVGKAPEDQRGYVGAIDGIERPGFLIGTAGETLERRLAQIAELKADKQCVKPVGKWRSGLIGHVRRSHSRGSAKRACTLRYQSSEVRFPQHRLPPRLAW